jgi:NAD(P)-dependent dehydrogenase (short-subunit alcohol dehydrogenase family)
VILIFGGGGIAEGIAEKVGPCQFVDKHECDVKVFAHVQAKMHQFKPKIVINCAGVSHVASIADSSPYDWADEIMTNLVGSYHVAKCAVDYGVKTQIHIASVAGMYGKPQHSGYSASKRGVISLVQSLGMEGHDAYAISPGRVNTKMREHDYPGEDPRTRLTPGEIGSVVADILDGKYNKGDNIIIRRIGHTTQPIRVDNGEPWRSDLKVGQPPAV